MPSFRSGRAGRGALFAAAAGVSFALYAQTLGLKPGLYEFTSTADVQLPPDVAAKMPPQALARMQKPRIAQHCITQPDLDHVSQQISSGQPNRESCRVTEHSISGGTVKFTEQCEHRTAHFEGSFTSESFQGTMVSNTEQGRAFTVKIAAHRIGDCSK